MLSGRRIAFDYGDVRIGIAVSDPSGLLASPIGAISNVESTLSSEVSKYLLEYQPIYIAVGVPKHLSGSASATEISVMNFVSKLRELTEVPIYAIDERLTTVSAARTLRDRGGNAKSSKSEIDAYAAAEILDSALNQERISGSPKERLL